MTTPTRPAGIVPAQAIGRLIAAGAAVAKPGIEADQIQPASLDLRLGPKAYRVRASFLPGPDASVIDKVAPLAMHEVDLRRGAVLEKGCVYIVPLLEKLKLPADLAASANPKSSTGRLDIFTRLIADNARSFDQVPAGYRGGLYLEISPRTFSVLVREGDRLNQLRFRYGAPGLDDAALRQRHAADPLIERRRGEAPARLQDGLLVTIDLKGERGRSVIGYRAKRHTPVVDLRRIGAYDPAEFWEALPARPDGTLILNPDDFYILASAERFRVPHDLAAEMIAYDTAMGEFRIHYAGFFDPGFGWSAAHRRGTRAVLEVRSHEVPFLLEHGQGVGRLVFEKLSEATDRAYGGAIGSNYAGQSLTLAKQFRR
ncbi:MAG: 2'-deoxycytidine 5'-triphosphate deaminase [Ferrovibrionaceae bacterium]